MTIGEKREFVEELFSSLKESVLQRLDKTPAYWDGVQLRQYISDKAKDAAYVPMDRRTKKQYNNDVLTRGL